MWMTVVVWFAVAQLTGLGVLTGVGSRRRGSGWAATALSVVFFPVAWAVWYLRDLPPAQAS